VFENVANQVNKNCAEIHRPDNYVSGIPTTIVMRRTLAYSNEGLWQSLWVH